MGACCDKEKLAEESYIPPEPNELYMNIPNYASNLGRKVKENKYQYRYNGREWEGIEVIEEETGARLGKMY